MNNLTCPHCGNPVAVTLSAVPSPSPPLIIAQKPSPNFSKGRAGYKPEAIVIHVMVGTLPGTDSWFANPASKVSAHYGIGKAGQIHQYVDESNTAWHAGRILNPTWKEMMRTSTGGYVNPNSYTLGIEHEGDGKEQWTEAMYQASASLIATLCSRYQIPVDRAHIVGHREIFAGKTCPGTGVDLDRLIKLAKAMQTI